MLCWKTCHGLDEKLIDESIISSLCCVLSSVLLVDNNIL